MAPTPQEHRPCLSPEKQEAAGTAAPTLNPDSIVISGISGLFPMSSSIDDFSKILYNKVNPVNNEIRWNQKLLEAPEYVGQIPELDRFDSQFFMVHKRLGESMDPMARKILEQSYQAIYDAGLSPKHLNGKKVGVYVASAFSDSEKYGLVESVIKSGYGITGVSKTMFANRVSYWLNAKGPSMNLDGAESGFMVALEEAVRAIRSGDIESAIVACAYAYLVPYSLVHSSRLVRISQDGKTRSFDQNADGSAKSDAICVLFIQKAKHALRAYAEVVHVKNEFTLNNRKENEIFFGFIRNTDNSANFLRKFYKETCVLPEDVEYIEACGTATPDADKAELQSIEEVFCNDRSDPLLVGSVISNIGMTDAASGGSAITKVLLGYHHGLIASNLNCETPRKDIPAIKDGRMSIVTDHKPFRGTYSAVNCLSVTGINSHALLRGYSKAKDLSRYTTAMPRLLTVSARQKKYVKDIFESLKTRPIDAEEIALLQNIHSTNISGHLGRGYIVLETNDKQNTVCLSECVAHSDNTRRPLWFVYSGMGSQWAGMGAQLMRIPIFAAAIERCHKVLETKGIDLVQIITSPDNRVFDNVLNSFVGIASIQVGITDILKAMGLQPDKIIGHSVGELGCAYADGCLTAEEMILAAWSRGQASNDAILIRGAMAAIGLGYQQLSKLSPPSIEIACHNSSTSSTISGPEESIRQFVATLTANGIFAKEVPSANIAYHSQYIANAGPHLLKLLSEIIKEPKARSERWISTSVPQERWDEHIAKYCSAEYLTNNLLSPVLFEESSSLIPSNAVLVEIAPHGLLQAILKRALPGSCTNIPLTQRGHKDNAQFLLDGIGKLYIEGYNPQVQAIYPKVEFPVSTGTPHLAHYVKWNHSDLWTIVEAKYTTKFTSSCTTKVSIYDDEYSYLTGNVIQGHMLFPFAGALVAVWDILAMTLQRPKKKLSVQFRDVHFYSQPILYDQKQMNLNVSFHRGNGKFEILNEESKIATGFIIADFTRDDNKVEMSNEKCGITSDEIYNHFGRRGYSYRDAFQSIVSVSESLTAGEIQWNDNWVTFIDGLLQLNNLKCSHDGVSQPSQIRDLTIDVDKHAAIVEQSTSRDTTILRAEISKVHESIRCGGVLLQHLKTCNLPSIKLARFQLMDNNANYISVPDDKLSTEKKYSLQIGDVGNLDTLSWEEAPPTAESGVEVMVEYAGVNMLDVSRATGVSPCVNSEKYFGMDFSGFNKHGERVMGLVRNGAASTVVSGRPELLWPVPAHWTLEEAATVPLAYTQAFYYLCVKSELQRSWRVLVHGAAGALGQAVISIALAHGCKVFATVSNSAKKKFLLRLFPELDEASIGNSRDNTFGDMVLNATDGEGCNIVISCVRDELKNISLKCAAFSGVTIDMVQIQNKDKFEYGMFHMTKQRSYIAADFSSLFDLGKKEEFKTLQLLVSEGIAQGYVRPLTHVTFGLHEAKRAFRLLAESRHRGRALLRIKDPLASAIPRVVCSPQATYVIVWDGKPLGLNLADRLIARGAKRMRIICLDPTTQCCLQLRLWDKVGVDVEIQYDELADVNAVRKVLQGHVEGIFIAVTDQELNVKTEKLISNIYSATQNSCALYKYFAVVTVRESIVGEKTCLSRADNGLLAVALKLPTYNKANETNTMLDEYSWNRSAVDAIELALSSKLPVLTAKLQALKKPSLADIFPILADNGQDGSSLQDLGLREYLPVIQLFLTSVYHVSLDDEKVLKLTKKKLLEIEMTATDRKFDDTKGLATFFAMKDHDELQTTCAYMPVTTLLVDNDNLLGGIDSSRPHLFVVPGMEGFHARFHRLCERLKLAAVVLQPGLERPHETPKELATRYSEILLKHYKLQNNFYLLGYEFGVVVALELAAILEDKGLTGTVYCIGDGPDEMKTLLESELALFDSATSLQEGLVKHIFSLMTNDSPACLERDLQGCSTWQERVDASVRALLGRAPHTAQYMRELFETAYARMEVAQRAVVTPRALRSRIVLMRAHREREHEHGDTCSLQLYTQRPLIVHDLAAPMAHAAEDLLAPAIINKYLDDELLQNYESSNLCQSQVYLFK